MTHKCCFCGTEVTFLFSYQIKVKGQKYYICPDCHTKYRHRRANFLPDGTAKVIEIEDSEIRKKCNVCGHVYCYSAYDLRQNSKKENAALLSSVAGLAEALNGGYTASAVHQGNADNRLNGVVDYNRCPHCGSMDVRTLSKEEWNAEQAKEAQGSIQTPAVSTADELKKFKDLLDSGVITQEEFDAKKKQLLGL